jgi:glucose-6-phosphate-specific signal transduction histidine kinase
MASDINLKALAGSALAVTNMIVMLGGVLFQPLIGKFLDILASKRHTLLTYTWQNYSTSDFQQALTLLPVGIFLSLILLFFIKKKPACS